MDAGNIFELAVGRTVPTLLINGHLDSGCTPTKLKKRKPSPGYSIDNIKKNRISDTRTNSCSSMSGTRSELTANASTSCSALADNAIQSKQKRSRPASEQIKSLPSNSGLIAKPHPELPGLYLVEVSEK